MPNLSGIELVQRIRRVDNKTSIVIISAHTDVEFLLSSITLNLLEYIVKPLTQDKLFNIFDKFIDINSSNKSNDFIFDKDKNKTISNSITYDLSLKESMFLDKIISSNRVISYDEIEEDIWDGKTMSQNALRLFIKNLRKKLPKDFIKNVPSQGYLLNSN